MRVEQNHNISTALTESKNNLGKLDQQNTQNQTMRDQLQAMQAKLRRMEVGNSQAVIENENLKNVLKFETDLRKARDAKEQQLLGVASAVQDDSMKWASENVKRIMFQDKLVLD